MRLKGISPLIAAVLLIAVTMAIAGVLAFWASGFAKSKSQQFSNQTYQIQLCSQADFSIYTNIYNETSKLHKIILENKGPVSFKITSVDYIYTNGIERKDINFILATGSQLQELDIANVTPGFVKFRVNTECPNLAIEKSV